MNNSKRNSSNKLNLLNLDSEDFLLWKEHYVTRIVTHLYQERLDDIFEFLKDAAQGAVILSDIDQTKMHEAIRLYEDFIDLDYETIVSHYEEPSNEDDTTSMGQGFSST